MRKNKKAQFFSWPMMHGILNVSFAGFRYYRKSLKTEKSDLTQTSPARSRTVKPIPLEVFKSIFGLKEKR